MGCVRRSSPPLSLSLSFIDMFVFRFGNDNDRYRYHLSTFSAVVVPKLFEFRYPTLISTRNSSSVYECTRTYVQLLFVVVVVVRAFVTLLCTSACVLEAFARFLRRPWVSFRALGCGARRGPPVYHSASLGPGRAPWRVLRAFKVEKSEIWQVIAG